MTFQIKTYREPLSEDEVSFLTVKEAQQRTQYYNVYKLLMVLAFVVPFITSWYRAYEGAPNAFSYLRFFVTAAILLSMVTAATYGSYRYYHKGLIMDLNEKTKTTETNRITKKIYIPTKNSFHFYTDSQTTLSIEVSEEYYQFMKVGDEVSLQYTTHSRLYLGYF